MTAIVGVKCKNGIVIGTDSSATFVHGQQFRTIEQPTKKIEIIKDRIIIAGTGSIGLGQRFCDITKNAYTNNIFNQSPFTITQYLSKETIQNFGYTFAEKGQFGALLAFPSENTFHLCEFDITNFQPEFKREDQLWYCSMGSAQPITDPFLALMRDVFWQNELPTVNEGIFAVTWTLQHAIDINTGGVNEPIQMATLEQKEDGSFIANLLDENELEEHKEHIKEGKQLLRNFRKKHKIDATDSVPQTPKLK